MFTAENIVFIACFLVLLLIAFILSKANKSLASQTNAADLAETRDEIKLHKNVFVFIALLVAVLFIGYKIVVRTQTEAHVMEWLNLLVRWAHVTFGIAWIGASFYFVFLENSLNRSENLRGELAGNLWAIHGGGFYYVEKYKVAPAELPKQLHWFKYEAYFTWLSGFILLTLVYFMNAKAVMLDPQVSDISPAAAVGLGLGSLIIGWLVYDLMCRSPLVQKKKLFALIGFGLVVLMSFFLSRYLSGRAAFMMIGALLGTIMAGNVFFVIIPSQKALVAAAKAGKPVDPELGKYAGLRSLHNNYITLPVIFVMISNHFPTTFGNTYNWAILAGLTLASVAVKHYLNLHEKGEKSVWMLPAATIAILALVFVTAPKPPKSAKDMPPVAFSQVQPVFQKRCVQCHSAHPTDDVQITAPNGIMFDTPDEIKEQADRILVRAVQTKTMPQGNKTGITEDERNLIGVWIAQGAKVQ